jgi:hypothetical protein
MVKQGRLKMDTFTPAEKVLLEWLLVTEQQISSDLEDAPRLADVQGLGRKLATMGVIYNEKIN